MFEVHEVSNPYLYSVSVYEAEEVITWAVDQLWINPDTNTQEILTEYYNEHYPARSNSM